MIEPQTETNLTGDQMSQLRAFVHDNREELLATLDDLSEEQSRRRLVPSQTSLLALVKHATFVEKVMFQVAVAGRTRTEVGVPDSVEESFELDDADTIVSVIGTYREAVAESERVTAGIGPDDLAVHNRRGPLTIRWAYIHMVEELARHAGHADILREQILAADATG